MTNFQSLNYEYLNENQIDEELKCIICKQPLQSPVSLLVCNHTFCKGCIEVWLRQQQTCPTCRQPTVNSCPRMGIGRWQSPLQCSFVPINTRIVLNQLDRLLVRCLICQESNIQRCHFENHEEVCIKRTVPCPSADIKCTWSGPRDRLSSHMKECPFQQVRPIIEELQGNLNSAQTTQAELKKSVERLEGQVAFLLAFVNQGNPMGTKCDKSVNNCQLANENGFRSNKYYQCKICDQQIHPCRIALHTCSSNECICQQCVQNQYSYHEEENDDEHFFYNDDTEEQWN
ncbi:unnamed protein product [Adineta ricciae]|uniref:RING-type domain-containing protein n=1 Tax=Adineta ricciae TaxID=249248 RepID=A0A813RLG2_ADIRI|nr:unnamed protein product [Adineta ricciae]CAF1473449.1 unnamed protein product [Adineta ricciae]